MDVQFLTVETSPVAVQSSWLRISSALGTYYGAQHALIQGDSLQLQCFSFSFLHSQPSSFVAVRNLGTSFSSLSATEYPPTKC